jgi:hypothetical protein
MGTSPKSATANGEYRVQPHGPDHQLVSLTPDERERTKGLGGEMGCLVWAVILLACYFLIRLVWEAAVGEVHWGSLLYIFLCAIVVASIGVAFINPVVRRKRIYQTERNKNEQARQAEAKSLTSKLARNYESSIKLATELSTRLANASSWLEIAESEYHANAFAPFWDAVEQATWFLSDFNSKAVQLTGNADEYYTNLNKRTHNFPPFPVQHKSIPDPSPVVDQLRRIVRMGQTNFQFANIWEHRRTREVLILGFTTLGEAVGNLRGVISDSIYSLQQSVSSDIAILVEEEIRTRETLNERMLDQNRMLDDIQHHRKPATTGTLSKW